MRPLFLPTKSPRRWPKILALLSVCTGFLVGGYWLGDKNGSEAVVEALQVTCGRAPTIMEFANGSKAACLPLKQAPEVEQKVLPGGLTKDPVV